jgi:hypothetical protein
VALEDFDARKAAAGADARGGPKDGDQEVWDGDVKELGVREVAEDFFALFLLIYPGKGIWKADEGGYVA